MALKTAPFDAAEVLDTQEAIEEFIAAAFETEDPAFIAQALGIVARARNMSKLAEEIGMSRPALYRALSGKGNRSSQPSRKSCARSGSSWRR